MAYPVKPTAAYDYTTFQTGAPNTPLPAVQVENDFAGLKTAVDATIDFITGSFGSTGRLKPWQLPTAQDLEEYVDTATDAATAAALSASSASASAAAAAAAFDQFDDRYLGAKASDPALDNDGNALIAGALYYNTGSNEMRQWDGAAWLVLAAGMSQTTADARYLQLTGGTVSGALVLSNTVAASGVISMSGAAINEAKGADIASASTINLTTATGNVVDLTGTTTVTAITLAEGASRTVRTTGALILTHGASLVLPTGANITTAAGDYWTFRGYAAGVVRMTGYQLADGRALTPPVTQQYAQAYCTVSAGVLTTQKSTGFTSIVRDSTGLFTCTLSSAMPDTNYVVEFTAGSTSGITLNRYCGEDLSTARTTTVFHLYVNGDGAGLQDPANLNIRVFA